MSRIITRRCRRCRAIVNRATAYKQKEWTRSGGAKIHVNAYYCAHCCPTAGPGGGTSDSNRSS